MASTSSGASSSSSTPSPGAKTPTSQVHKLPSNAIMASETCNDADDTEDDLNNVQCNNLEDNKGRLSAHWVDEIRFSSYRLAAKMRLLQQRTGLGLLDIWNVMEAFRENGLNGMDADAAVGRQRLETILESMYGALAKRMPPSSSNAPQTGSGSANHPGDNNTSDLQAKASWLFSWLFTALKPAGASTIKVRTLKAAMSTLCSGKLMDKLRYVFSQLADSNGHLMPERFSAFLRDVARIASAVGEPRQQQQETAESIFATMGDRPITVNDFIETLMSDPGPACLSWLPVLHRIANAESVIHRGLHCGSCGLQDFPGLRYRSDRSTSYNLCQGCFWRGMIDPDHREDVFKEYNSFKAASGTGRSTTPSSGTGSLRKSLACLQNKKSSKKVPKFPDQPEKTIDLSNMIPQEPPAARLNYGSRSLVGGDMDESFYQGSHSYMGHPTTEDEHELIAAYANQLASSNPEAFGQESSEEMMAHHSRHLVRELEKKNREIMRDISQLRHAHQARSQQLMHHQPDDMVSELQDLRHHKADLEDRLGELQTARRDLMVELDELMKLLKVQGQPQQQQQQQQQQPQQQQQQQLHHPHQHLLPHQHLHQQPHFQGPVVVVSPAGVRMDDVTDVSGIPGISGAMMQALQNNPHYQQHLLSLKEETPTNSISD